MAKRPTRGQQRLPGTKPAGMVAARDALDTPQRPVYGPERPRDATLGLFRNHRAHFDAGATGEP